MPVYKDDGNGTFYVQCYYRDARGSKRHKTKRGFSSEVEAAVWESQFKSLNGGAMDMTFSEFVEVYASEVKPRIREHTWITKEYIINDKLVPFFGDMRMCDVRPIDVIRWQNELTEHRDADGKPWAPTYLRTVNNQLNAIFKHWVIVVVCEKVLNPVRESETIFLVKVYYPGDVASLSRTLCFCPVI